MGRKWGGGIKLVDGCDRLKGRKWRSLGGEGEGTNVWWWWMGWNGLRVIGAGKRKGEGTMCGSGKMAKRKEGRRSGGMKDDERSGREREGREGGEGTIGSWGEKNTERRRKRGRKRSDSLGSDPKPKQGSDQMEQLASEDRSGRRRKSEWEEKERRRREGMREGRNGLI